MLKDARKRARKAGVPLKLTLADLDLLSASHCPVLGIPFTIGDGRPSPSSRSIDRLTPATGYITGNVRTISHSANSMKSDADLSHLQSRVATALETGDPRAPLLQALCEYVEFAPANPFWTETTLARHVVSQRETPWPHAPDGTFLAPDEDGVIRVDTTLETLDTWTREPPPVNSASSGLNISPNGRASSR